MHPTLWFIVVGSVAAGTHFVVYVLCNQVLENSYEISNACGFVVAFGVSFIGHHFLSFNNTPANLPRSFVRFVCTALAGLITNECVFMLLFRVWGIHDWISWLMGVGCAAAQTYLLSRYWAFKETRS
jgi:putative flippase GtrA